MLAAVGVEVAAEVAAKDAAKDAATAKRPAWIVAKDAALRQNKYNVLLQLPKAPASKFVAVMDPKRSRAMPLDAAYHAGYQRIARPPFLVRKWRAVVQLLSLLMRALRRVKRILLRSGERVHGKGKLGTLGKQGMHAEDAAKLSKATRKLMS